MRTPTVGTLPARPDRANEDAVALGDGIAVVVDGAGLPKELGQGCAHEVAWFSRAIADAFRDRLADGMSMKAALAAAIEGVADRHRDGCDLSAGSPSATVAAWRIRGGQVEHLVLCDASVVLVGPDGQTVEVTDQRIGSAVTGRVAALAGLGDGGSPTREQRRRFGFEALEGTRNRADGWWCVHHDPAAAEHALTGTVAVDDLVRIVAASDGGTRGFQLLHAQSLDEFGRAAADPATVTAVVRAAESARREVSERDGTKVHDDLTLVVQEFG